MRILKTIVLFPFRFLRAVAAMFGTWFHLAAPLLQKAFIGVLLFFIAFYLFAPLSWRLSWEYSIPIDQVKIEPKPHDCEFMAAPLGDKNCTYKRVTQAFNASGELVGGDNAPRYYTDENRTDISWDDGKTWTLIKNARLDRTVASVEVSWTKVESP